MNMKKKSMYSFLLLFLVLALASCNKEAIEGGWIGKIVRSNDNVCLGKVGLCFKKDSLFVYSNVIFGSRYICFLPDKKEKNVYNYVSLNEPVISICLRAYEDSLNIQGSDFFITATKNEEETALYIEKEYKGQIVPQPSASYIWGTWEGDLFRVSDNKKLSRIVLESFLDSVKVYSNAIYGRNNVLSYLVKYDEIAEAFSYNSSQFNWLLSEKEGKIFIQGKGYYALLNSVDNINKDFYRNKEVSQDPNLYLAGNIYRGELSPKGKYALYSTMVKSLFQIEILDDERLRCSAWTKISNSQMGLFALFGGVKDGERIIDEIHTYSIENGFLRFGKEKWQIKENGNTLYIDQEKYETTLRKGTSYTKNVRKKSGFKYKECWNCGGAGSKYHFSAAQQKRIYGKCSVCNGSGKVVVYE